MDIFELLFTDKKKELERVRNQSIKALDYLSQAMQRRNERVNNWIKENPNTPIPPHIMILI